MMKTNLDKELENIFIIQPITRENELKYRVLHEEAVSLIESAGAQYAGSIYQNVREINSSTYIGTGKINELNELLEGLEVTLLFNGELTPSQTLNISALLDNRKVIDRTTLILDIFAKNAKTSEGKLQVELAQLQYLYPRLKGKGVALSRLGGGVGTRGPGETQLETDRRYIRARIHYLEQRLNGMEKRRALQTTRRKKEERKTIALVGYTNTGKSTLLNVLTNADTYVKNELFATLDPTVREWNIEGIPFLLSDTVGFLQDLPHNLIEAFKSTLESAVHADLALIVCDATGEYDMQLETTLQTLKEMQFSSPYLVVMNKCENIADFTAFPYDSIPISAKENQGIDALKNAVIQQFRNEFAFYDLYVPYTRSDEYATLRKYVAERKIEYLDEGKIVSATVPTRYADLFLPFLKRK